MGIANWREDTIPNNDQLALSATGYYSLGCTMNFGPDATEGPITVLMAVSDTIVATTRTVTSTDGLDAYSVKIQTSHQSRQPCPRLQVQMPHRRSLTVPRQPARPLPHRLQILPIDQTGLSTSAKIAIGVAVPIVVLLGILRLFCMIKRRKRPQKKHGNGRRTRRNHTREIWSATERDGWHPGGQARNLWRIAQ
ncbi:hypothetical protein BJ166DRAFT_521422 [Pestalotiopsis sp. NC0098]|nr:hypothetical protein BJ166DRAFT_521422 [Pestalotiopsis sp. NC0098]